MQQNKYSSPRHMSRSALPILYANRIKKSWTEFISIFILILFSLSHHTLIQQILYPLAFVACYLIEEAVQVFFKYYFFKFYVSEGNLVVNKGVFKKETLNIPTYKIHSLRTKSGALYRVFDMKGISVDTLAEKEKEVELILEDTDWNKLLSMFKDDEPPKTTDDEAVDDNEEERDVKIDNTLHYPNTSLIKGAFCQNHLRGTVIMAVILFNILMQTDERIISTAAEYAVEKTEEIMLSPASIIISLILLYIISLILWLGKVMLRYGNMQIDISTKKLFFESGLITRRSVRFAHDKLSSIKVKVNPLERIMHSSTVSMIQAFNVTDENEKHDVLIYGCKSHETFLKWWIGNDYEHSSDIMDVHSGRGVFWYSIRFTVTLSAAAALFLLFMGYHFFAILMVILMAGYIIEGCLAAQRSHILLKDDHIEIYGGGYASVTYYLKYDDVENISLRKTPLTPYTNRAHLSLSTNGSYMSVRSLDKNEALKAYDVILAKMYASRYNED